MTPPTDRALLRQTLRTRRRDHVAGLPDPVRGLCFQSLPSAVLARLPVGGRVALYAATGDEAPTGAIARHLAARGHPLALPALANRKSALRFLAWRPDDPLVEGPFGLRQPDERAPAVAPDAIIVPMLGFDAGLARIGQGGGHYDRALAAHPRALRIGLAWSAQEVDAVPVAAWDMPMDIIVTEQQFLEKVLPS